MDGKLPPERKHALNKLEEFKKSMPRRKKYLQAQKVTLETEIQKSQNARLIAVQKVYPGVVLHFGVIYKEIADVMGPSCFQLSHRIITWVDYRSDTND